MPPYRTDKTQPGVGSGVLSRNDATVARTDKSQAVGPGALTQSDATVSSNTDKSQAGFGSALTRNDATASFNTMTTRNTRNDATNFNKTSQNDTSTFSNKTTRNEALTTSPNDSTSWNDPVTMSLDARLANCHYTDIFDGALKWQFNKVPLDSQDESRWYGPWDTVIHRLFPDGEFQIAPQHMIVDRRGGPEWTVFYLVKYRDLVVACVIEVKPYYHYEYTYLRILAYEQLEARLVQCVKDDLVKEVPIVYGVQCLGHQFMVMKMHTARGATTPALRREMESVDRKQIAPQRWWRHKVTKKEGCLRLIRLVKDVKETLRVFEPLGRPISPYSDDPSDQCDSEEEHS